MYQVLERKASMKTKNGIRVISEVDEAKLFEAWLRQGNYPNWDKMQDGKYDFEENLKLEEALGK